jgi:hypothetical protein
MTVEKTNMSFPPSLSFQTGRRQDLESRSGSQLSLG